MIMRLIDADELIKCIPSEEYNSRFAVMNAPTINPQKWIPVSERQPEYEMDVLLQFTSNMCVGFFHPSESWIIWSGGDWCTGVLEGDEEPIAWMPLPEPWKEGNDEVN